MKQFNLREYTGKQQIITRKGLSVRIICTDRKRIDYPIVALIQEKNQEEYVRFYTVDGEYVYKAEHDFDLFFKPMTKTYHYAIFKINDKVFTSPFFESINDVLRYVKEQHFKQSDIVKITDIEIEEY